MSGGYLDIYYARTLTSDAQRPALDGHAKTQVCIVGGGLAGLNTALGLAERGVTDVVLFEGQRVGWGGRGTTQGTEPCNLRHLMYGDMTRVYPQLADVKIETVWSGIMSYPIQCMIQMGELKLGHWYGQGFGGQGMAQTMVAGEALAAAIAQGDDTIYLFAPFGLNWAGGPVGKMYGEAYQLYVRAYDQITTARGRRRVGRCL